MPAKRDMSEVLQQYMDENKMFCMEGQRGVRYLDKIVRSVGYDDQFSTSAIHAFLEDNSGCIEAIVEWIQSQRNSEWIAMLESQVSDPDEIPEDDPEMVAEAEAFMAADKLLNNA